MTEEGSPDDATAHGEKIEAIVGELIDADHAVALTGAGVSTASGIPDFRSEGGIWDEFDPQEFHEALATLETEGVLDAVVTQNIDGLHRAAGSETVVELHGNADVFLAVGSSLSVQPAASLPRTAHRSGGSLAIINLEETPVSDVAAYE